MSIINNKRIAIVGGGPGGLTLARLLQMNGAEVKVYERDLNRNVRVQGATLDLHEESGLAALTKAGLMDAFKANYRPGADKMRIVDKHAHIMRDEHINAENEMFRPEIDRGPLRDILLDSLEPGTVVWNSQFVTLSPAGDSWILGFQNGNSAYADLVIAADGANSKIRPYITGIRPSYVGLTAIEGTVYDSALNAPRIHELLNGGKIFAFGDEKSLIVSSKGDGSLQFYPGFKTDEYWYRDGGINFSDRGQVLNWFKREFRGWDPIWLELFENAQLPLMPRPQYCMPIDQHWESLPNLTMLGDAAHLMPPYAGEGVNMAMLDALELSERLTGDFGNLGDAIKSYETNMLTRAAEVIEVTLEQTAALHSPHSLSYMTEMFA